jgi:N-acyl-D-amino-acid deacylase
MKLDLVFRGGTIIDGTGRPSFDADLGVADGMIAEVGSIPRGQGREELDIRGQYITPGFIDIHSHSDYTLLVDPRAVSQIAQGVTMEVIGNCGWGCSPIANPVLSSSVIYGYGEQVPITWHTTAEYLERLEQARPAVNVAMLVPNGQLRLATVGLADRAARPAELARMKTLLAQSLEEGAIGYSTGLEYVTEVGASEEDVAELCHVTALAGGLYATHTRNREERAAEAIEEAIRTADHAGCRLQISHLTPRGGISNLERCIEHVDAALARGSDLAFDMHTRVFGTTNLRIVLPPWAMAGGRDALARRLANAADRDRMKTFRNLITSVGDWDKVVLLETPSIPGWSNRSFGEIGRSVGRDPYDCVCELLLAEIDHLHRPMVILHTYTEDLLRRTYQHASCMVGSDATALAPNGPLAVTSFHGAYTWASWFYRRMVRETKTFTPEEAVYKITGLPAKTLGLTDRGTLSVGHRADLAVFDPELFGERGTTERPSQTAVGMTYVLVNGVVTWRDSGVTGQRAGQVLRGRKREG